MTDTQGDSARVCRVCGKAIGPELEERIRHERCYPFCSKRCQWIDLGAWLDASYRIPTSADADDLAPGEP